MIGAVLMTAIHRHSHRHKCSRHSIRRDPFASNNAPVQTQPQTQQNNNAWDPFAINDASVQTQPQTQPQTQQTNDTMGWDKLNTDTAVGVPIQGNPKGLFVKLLK